jgi:N-glycosylase/DNA lyase
MNRLISQIKNLRNSKIKEVINKRIQEFSSTPRDFNSLFRELAFCILTAGTSAELGLKTIEHLGNTLFLGSRKEIQKKLKKIYRFHTTRATYLYEARKNFRKIDLNDRDIRKTLIENIKGIGMKEASHFLRNIGFNNYAIVDFHIVNVLVKNNLIKKPKTLTPKRYLEIESVLKKLAEQLDMSLGELDLYLWYMETGKVLK